MWDGPDCLRSVHALKKLYPQSQRLFCDILGVQDARLENLIREARLLSQLETDLSYITKLFLEIEKLIKDDTSESITRALRTSRIFPTRNAGSRAEFDQLLRGDSTSEWFIADCTHFRHAFQGMIPFLAISVGNISRLKKVLRKAGVENRRLSAAAKGSAQTVGTVTFLDHDTSRFTAKVDSILR